MSKYTENEIRYSYITGIKYRLNEEIVWEIGKKGGPSYTVPVGFEFDVSIPKVFRWIIDPNRVEFFKAAALHDHMLTNGWDRLTAGACFHEALRAEDVSLPTRLVMWLAVSLWQYN